MEKEDLQKSLEYFSRSIQLQDRFACKNKKCRNFLIYVKKELKFEGFEYTKTRDKKQQRYRCLVCNKKFTGRLIFGAPKIRDLVPYNELLKSLNRFLTFKDICKTYKIRPTSAIKILNLLADTEASKWARLEHNTAQPTLFLVEIPNPIFKKNGSGSVVFFHLEKETLAIKSIYSAKDTAQARNKIIAYLVARDTSSTLKIYSKNKYKSTRALPLNSPPVKILLERLEVMRFKKWCRTTGVAKLHRRMLLLSLAYNNRLIGDYFMGEDEVRPNPPSLNSLILKRKSG